MTLEIRAAEADDVPAMSRLADRKRRQYAAYQPVFWRVAPDAQARHEEHLHALVEADGVVALVADVDGQVRGFAIGHVVPAPPVYDPGGPTLYVDDFVVSSDRDWRTLGAVLLRALAQAGRARDAAQVVVVSGALDSVKRRMLADADLEVASEWWVAPLR